MIRGDVARRGKPRIGNEAVPGVAQADPLLENGGLLFQGHRDEFDVSRRSGCADPYTAGAVGKKVENLVIGKVPSASKILAAVPRVSGLAVQSPQALDGLFPVDSKACELPHGSVGGRHPVHAAGRPHRSGNHFIIQVEVVHDFLRRSGRRLRGRRHGNKKYDSDVVPKGHRLMIAVTQAVERSRLIGYNRGNEGAAGITSIGCHNDSPTG